MGPTCGGGSPVPPLSEASICPMYSTYLLRVRADSFAFFISVTSGLTVMLWTLPRVAQQCPEESTCEGPLRYLKRLWSRNETSPRTTRLKCCSELAPDFSTISEALRVTSCDGGLGFPFLSNVTRAIFAFLLTRFS
jgi:hypothetical protein